MLIAINASELLEMFRSKKECLESYSNIVLFISSLTFLKYLLEVGVMTLLPSPLHFLFENHCLHLPHIGWKLKDGGIP